MAKSPDAFRTISEVADWLGVQAHVLRFWESKFSQVKPVKRAGGRRYYRPQDMRLLGGIKRLLHDEGMTIKGVQKLLREQGVKHVAAMSQPLTGEEKQTISATGSTPSSQTEAAQVLDFRPKEGAEDHPDDGTSTEPEAAPAPQPEPVPDTEPDEERVPEPEPSAEEEPAKEPDAAGAPQDAETETAEDTPLAEGPASAIPAFLSRPGAGSIKADPPQPIEAAPEPEPPTPAPRKVDVAPYPDDVINADPGVLSRLAKLPRPLPAETAKQLAPFIDRLRAALDKSN